MDWFSLREAMFNRRMLFCLFAGFASGLPYYILATLVPAWLRTEGVGLAEIGLFTLIGIPYTWKFFWAPLMDRFELPFLGLRRGWMLVTQLALIVSLSAIPFFNAAESLWSIACLALGVAFFSASQDIVLDAYRREILPDQELGLGNSVFVNTWRAAGFIPGSLSLILADQFSWETVFIITALFMSIGVLLTLSIKEPPHEYKPQTMKAAAVDSFSEFFTRNGLKHAILVIAFIFFYKLGDSLATALATPFYIDLGFSLTEIGVIAKNAGFWPMLIGSILGGILMIKIGINRALWLFGVVQMVSILGFAALAHYGNNIWLLGLVIAFEYLGVGLGTSAVVAFIARSASIKHTATQLALLTAVAVIPRSVANASTGFIVERVGWEAFFYFCTLMAVPGMALLPWAAPWNGDSNKYKFQKSKAAA
jgi:MFS transporter, PAT family, beta-lactamase induction signal transducer AmpG